MSFYFFREETRSAVPEAPQKGAQCRNENKCAKYEKPKILRDNDLDERSKLTNLHRNENLSQPKSTNVFKKKQVFFPETAIPDTRSKNVAKCASTTSLNDNIPTMQLYTPKQYKMRSAMSNTKVNIIPMNRTPIKCYFSDNILSQATPDCFSIVQVETPCSKSNDVGIQDQTLYEGENSNLTVGIRVRPLNAK